MDITVIYPNPVKEITTLQTDDNNLLNTTVKIVDMSGKLVKKFFIKNNFEIINMTGLPAGLYLLQMENGTSQKIIKQ